MTDDSVVREIQRETREELTLAEQNRLDRPDKRAQESRGLEGAARVEFNEQDWRKRRPETLEEIRAAVDAIGSPREDRLRVGERVFLPPEDALPPTRVLTDLERKAIERHLGGKVVRASILYRAGRGHVVEVEHDRAGAREMTLLSVVGDRVRDFAGIEARVDELARRRDAPAPEPEPVPEPEAAAPEPQPQPEPAAPAVAPEPGAPEPGAPAPVPGPQPEPQPAEAAGKRRFGLPFGRKKEAAPAEAEAPAAPAPETGGKRRFGMPKLGRAKGEEPAAPPAEAAPGEAAPVEKKGLGRFLKRK